MLSNAESSTTKHFPRTSLVWCVLASAILPTACGSSSPSQDAPLVSPVDAAERPTVFGGTRFAELRVPDNFDESRTYPLVMVLHGYGVTGTIQEGFFGSRTLTNNGEAFVIAPDGLVDSGGRQYWNADPMCCDFGGSGVDDVAYLSSLIEDIAAAWPIDPKQVYLFGHSNGSFMAYRMACERADLVAGIVGLAGAAYSLTCAPSQDVSVLHIHGDLDAVIPYSVALPSVTKWQGYNGCTGSLTDGEALDLDFNLPGTETRTSSTEGCPTAAVDLWTIGGGSHIPVFQSTFITTAWAWLSAHPSR